MVSLFRSLAASHSAPALALLLPLAACGTNRLRPVPVAPFATPATTPPDAVAAAPEAARAESAAASKNGENGVAPSAAPGHPGQPQIGPTQAGQPQTGPTQVGPTQVGPTQVGPTQVGPTQVGPTQIGQAENGEAAEPQPSGSGPKEHQASEAELRAELAQATEPAHAALELAARLSQREQHAEALAVVDAARQRSRQPALLLQRAELLRDLGQRHLALAELRGLSKLVGAAALPPSVRFEIAELEWLEGDRTAADAALKQLEADPAAAAWIADTAAMVGSLRRELDQPSPTRLRLRDCFGNLRGGATPSIRLAMLRTLAQVGPGGERAVRLRALAVAAGDESAAVRTGAVQLAEPADELGAPFAAAALADTSALVRGAAAAKAAALAPGEATTLLAERLRVEDDELAFVALYTALKALDPATPPLPLGAAATAAGRAAVVAKRERR